MPADLKISSRGGIDLSMPDKKFAVAGVLPSAPAERLSQTVTLSILILLIASTCVLIISGSLSAISIRTASRVLLLAASTSFSNPAACLLNTSYIPCPSACLFRSTASASPFATLRVCSA